MSDCGVVRNWCRALAYLLSQWCKRAQCRRSLHMMMACLLCRCSILLWLAVFCGDFPLGSGDPLNQDLPEWRLEPEPEYYVVRTKPAIVMCSATPAIRITFKCVGSLVPIEQQTNVELTDPVTGRKTLQSSIQVTRDEVEHYSYSEDYEEGGFWCECDAWNSVQGSSNPQHITSTRAHIEAAYMRRRFDRTPMSTRVAVGKTAELQCLPPDGKPLPRVFWLKDEVELKVAENLNFIISSEGSLIIIQARLQDAGNYTCGAVNLETRRLSESANLLVYRDGGWSAWTDWSDCSASCCKGTKRRTRVCDNPAPLNGGMPCFGESQAFVDCTSPCPGEQTSMP